MLADTLDNLVAGEEDKFDPAALGRLRDALARSEGHGGGLADLDARFSEARAWLEQARERARGWTLEPDGWEAMGPGSPQACSGARQR